MTLAASIRGVRKSFGGVPVLEDVSFNVEPGTVTVLAGENGAGKSTLFKILSGQLLPDRGDVRIGDVHLEHAIPRIARELGVGIIPQELAPYDELTVAENLFVGREPRVLGFVLKRREMLAEARRMLLDFGVDVDPSRRMRTLSVALTQIVEIIKATSSGARLLLMDEPTSSIPAAEVEHLYTVINRMREQGVAILYTTHRMAEIERIADRVIVLRDGTLVMDEPAANVSAEDIVTSMIGRELGQLFPELGEPQQETSLRITSLVRKRGAPEVSLTVRRGEILGIGGLVGAGRSALLDTIFGARTPIHGEVIVEGTEVPGGVRGAISTGMAYVPEDRKGGGLVLSRSILDNLTLPHLDSFAVAGVLRNAQRRRVATQLSDDVHLRRRSLTQLVENLSGGNQQKIVISRWLAQPPAVLLLDEPTRGVDVGARGEIYRIIADLAASGMAVVLVSSDMPELIGMSHRVCVMRGGQITGELSREQLDAPDAQAQIFHYASGEKAALTASVRAVKS